MSWGNASRRKKRKGGKEMRRAEWRIEDNNKRIETRRGGNKAGGKKLFKMTGVNKRGEGRVENSKGKETRIGEGRGEKKKEIRRWNKETRRWKEISRGEVGGNKRGDDSGHPKVITVVVPTCLLTEGKKKKKQVMEKEREGRAEQEKHVSHEERRKRCWKEMTYKMADEKNKQEKRKQEERDRWTGERERKRWTERMLTKQTEPECILIKALRSRATPQPYWANDKYRTLNWIVHATPCPNDDGNIFSSLNDVFVVWQCVYLRGMEMVRCSKRGERWEIEQNKSVTVQSINRLYDFSTVKPGLRFFKEDVR